MFSRLMSRKINQRWVSTRTLRKCGVNIPIKIAKSVLGIMQKLDYKFHISIPDNLIIIAHSITTDEYLYEWHACEESTCVLQTQFMVPPSPFALVQLGDDEEDNSEGSTHKSCQHQETKSVHNSLQRKNKSFSLKISLEGEYNKSFPIKNVALYWSNNFCIHVYDLPPSP